MLWVSTTWTPNDALAQFIEYVKTDPKANLDNYLGNIISCVFSHTITNWDIRALEIKSAFGLIVDAHVPVSRNQGLSNLANIRDE